jgi:hypothetical protein
LPPRAAGEKIPTELSDYYEEQVKKLEEEEKKLKAKQLNLNESNGDLNGAGNLKFAICFYVSFVKRVLQFR